MTAETDFFPALLTQEAAQKAEQAVKDRAYHLAEIRDSWRSCWCEWEGPKVEDSIHGRCEVGMCVVHSITHGTGRYHYMAPCRIDVIGDDFVEVTVDYPAGSSCEGYNGERLRLDLTEVWPPVKLLQAIRWPKSEAILDCPENGA